MFFKGKTIKAINLFKDNLNYWRPIMIYLTKIDEEKTKFSINQLMRKKQNSLLILERY